MSRATIGYRLPTGTIAYVYPDHDTIWRCDGLNFPYLNFHFDPQDGLYASKSVRTYWVTYPETHPHATLFEILYKKLGICDV